LLFDLLSNGGVPEASGFNVRFIQPRFDIFLGKLLCDIADRRLVLAVVAQEDIKDFGFGVLPVHANSVLYGKNLARKVDFEIKRIVPSPAFLRKFFLESIRQTLLLGKRNVAHPLA
jgi:hypothetical protein